MSGVGFQRRLCSKQNDVFFFEVWVEALGECGELRTLCDREFELHMVVLTFFVRFHVLNYKIVHMMVEFASIAYSCNYVVFNCKMQDSAMVM